MHKYLCTLIIFAICIAQNDYAMGIEMQSLAEEAPAINPAQAALAPQVNPQQNFFRQNPRITCTALFFIVAFGALIPLTFLEPKARIHHSFDGFPCAPNNASFSNECFKVKVDNCGVCSTQYSRISCPANGISSASDIIAKIKQEAEDTCGSDAQYCVAQASCDLFEKHKSSHDSACDPEGLANFIKSLRNDCARTPKKKPKKAYKQTFLQPHHAKAWDKKRRTQKFK